MVCRQRLYWVHMNNQQHNTVLIKHSCKTATFAIIYQINSETADYVRNKKKQTAFTIIRIYIWNKGSVSSNKIMFNVCKPSTCVFVYFNLSVRFCVCGLVERYLVVFQVSGCYYHAILEYYINLQILSFVRCIDVTRTTCVISCLVQMIPCRPCACFYSVLYHMNQVGYGLE